MLVDYTNITLNGKSGRSIITFISHLHHQNVSYESSSLEADAQAVRDAVDEEMFDISTHSSIVTGR